MAFFVVLALCYLPSPKARTARIIWPLSFFRMLCRICWIYSGSRVGSATLNDVLRFAVVSEPLLWPFVPLMLVFNFYNLTTQRSCRRITRMFSIKRAINLLRNELNFKEMLRMLHLFRALFRSVLLYYNLQKLQQITAWKLQQKLSQIPRRH